MIHHTTDQDCPSCKEKLDTCHPVLVEWFIWLKWSYPKVHVAWGWRGEQDQHNDFLSGRSKKDWPMSPHNNMKDGMPCSLALDIFTIDEQGHAGFDEEFYRLVDEVTQSNDYPLLWGGSFPHLKDMDHWQLINQA